MTKEERSLARLLAIKLINERRKLKDISDITNLSYTTVKRLKKNHNNNSVNKIKKRGSKPKLNEKDENYIVNFYLNYASMFNFYHFYEHFIVNQMGYNFSYSKLLRIFSKRKIGSPMSRKSTIRAYETLNKISKKGKKKKEKGLTEIERKLKYEISFKYAHPYMPRIKYFGEIVETDASPHIWFGNKKFNLHLFVDKATSVILGAYFDTQETLKGYYTAFKQVLINYGIPYKLIADNRTVFKYSEDTEKKTNFGIMCSFLGIELETTSVAQAKGTVERTFKTLQSRLAAELSFYGIKNINEANKYLIEFVKQHNEKALSKFNDIENRFECQTYTNKELDKVLSIFNKRVISGHCISYENNKYVPLNHKGENMYLHNKTKIVVAKSLTDTLHMILDNEIFDLKKIDNILEFSKNFNEKPIEKIEKIKYIPPQDHPWRNFFKMIFIELSKKKKNI